MRGLAIRVLHDPEAADDALQDAYIKAYQRRDSFRGDAALSSWLYTIVYRSCIDQHRRRKPTVPFEDDGHTAVNDRTSDHDSFDNRIGLRMGLRDALAHLSPAQRAAIWLVDAEGMTFAEASDILDVPPGTVASRVSRARATLRNILSGEQAAGSSEYSPNRPEDRP